MKKLLVNTVLFILIFSMGAGVFYSPVQADAAVLKLGDKVTIGKFDQDGNQDNGAEPISWTVVYMKSGKAVILADTILDMMAFSNGEASWAGSSLRAWLNDTFYKSAFSDAEKSFIDHKRLITMRADKQGFEKTEDYVYVLSDTEAKGYSDNFSESAKPSAVAAKKGLFTDDKGYGYWWLRAPGHDASHVAYTNPDGSIYSAGCKSSYALMGGVRPAVQIDLNKAGMGGNTLTIEYVFIDGKTAAKSYFAGISSGEKYDVKSPSVSGYAPDKNSVSGTMGNEDISVKVTYNVSGKLPRTMDAPKKVSSDNGNVVLKKVGVTGGGKVSYGYSLKNDVNSVSVWSEKHTFTGLVGGTKYYFFARATGAEKYVDVYSKGTEIYVDKVGRTIASPKILNSNHNAVCGAEVSANGGGAVSYGVSASNQPGSVKSWNKYPVFNGLSPNVKYYLFAKVAETDNFKEAYSYTEFTTTQTKSATEIPMIKNVSESIIEVEPIDLLIGVIKYGISEKADTAGVKEWSTSTVFSGLETGKRYYIFTKIENNSYYTGESFSYSSAVTVSGVRAVIPAKIEKVEGNTVTVKEIVVSGSDCIYYGISRVNSSDNVSVWQTENVFKDLLPNTDYFVFTKLSNGNSADDLISAGVYVKIKNISAQDGKDDVSDDKKDMPIWWIILLVISGLVLIGATVYILLKKRNSLKKFKLFARIKDVFVTAFKPIKSNDENDKYDDLNIDE
ncbi:MAG: hypothetical protein E7384_02870 [Ruminococcaceae bacterium]|nr:hypothetical protein [Oscillospiraceae bacterium]